MKICGLTNRADAELAVALGADILGVVLAESPRKADLSFFREIRDLPALKAAVVVLAAGESVPEDLAALVNEGLVDFLQFHGDESPALCARWPSFKALRLRVTDDAGRIRDYPAPATLVDAFSREARGGTGKRLSPELVEAARSAGPLWLAGGLNPDNVGITLKEFRPRLIDASSGLEAEPGKKDPEKMKRYFQEVRRYA